MFRNLAVGRTHWAH